MQSSSSRGFKRVVELEDKEKWDGDSGEEDGDNGDEEYGAYLEELLNILFINIGGCFLTPCTYKICCSQPR